MGHNGVSIDFIRGDLTALPFRNGTFNKILCANALQHLPTAALRETCIKEFSRVALPVAKVIVTVHNLSVRKKKAGWPKEERNAGSYSGTVQFIHRFELEEFNSMLNSSLIVDQIMAAGLPLPYKLKLSFLSARLEKVLRCFKTSIPYGHMLVGICHRKE